MKFPTSGFIFKSDMSADKTAFHRPTKKKTGQFGRFSRICGRIITN
jgi:hypothetical protein